MSVIIKELSGAGYIVTISGRDYTANTLEEALQMIRNALWREEAE